MSRGPAPADRERLPRERFARAKAIFCDAIDRRADERERFVAEACAGDAALYREVESLLANDRESNTFIETPAAVLLAAEAPSSGRPPQLHPGDRLAQYEIEAPLGFGGMGEVYRARDTRLRRQVAIKILNADQDDERSRGRLLREARHASVLGHPSICTVYEVGDADGRPFIVMEHVPGETLRAAIARTHGLPVRAVVRYGTQIAEALEHAHTRGLIHRDLKSANVMIGVDDRVKVLDFGLAQRLPDGADLHASTSFGTGTLALAGTLNYMAPEVLLGGAADARSDIWSVGILLFEMASGELPFKGQTAFETASAILQAGLPALPRGTPLALRLVIERCLERDPARRYQRAADLVAALRRWQAGAGRKLIASLFYRKMRLMSVAKASALVLAAIALIVGAWWTTAGGAPPAGMRTLAVLPLENLSAGEKEPYFADGVTEALIGEMGRTGVERVISRTTAMTFRGARAPVAEIARRLGVEGVVEGTVERSAGQVRLSLRLFDGRNGRVLWSATERRASRDVLALVTWAARGIAAGMKYAMTEEAGKRLAVVRAVDPDVYEAYLKGRYYWNQRTQPSLQRAVDYYKEAIRLDPTYAPAHAALADCYNQLGTVMVGTGSPGAFRPLAAASVIRALQIDPDLAGAHATLGYIKHYEWQWDEAERELERAIHLNPSDALAHIWYANLLSSRRRFVEATREVYLGRDLDPFSLVVNTNVAWTLTMAGRPQEALTQLRRTLELDPNYVQARMRLSFAYADLRRFDEAIAEAKTTVRLTGDTPSSLGYLASMYARAGRRTEARALLGQLLRDSRDHYVSPTVIAEVYKGLGDVDATFEWIDRAFAEHSNGMAYLALEPAGPVRSDPRFTLLLRRIGLE